MDPKNPADPASPTPSQNLNLRRRVVPGLIAVAASGPLRLLLKPLRRTPSASVPLTVFASYMVGDLFMALPALKRMAATTGRANGLRVICRPDCEAILAREGFQTIPFENAFITQRTPAGFLKTARAAWSLRGSGIGVALDLDADPRSALWLRLAGSPHVISFARPFGVLFDETFPLRADAVHQQDRDYAVVEEYLIRYVGPDESSDRGVRGFPIQEKAPVEIPEAHNPRSQKTAPWILSVWTRKAAKNWPLEQWHAFIESLIAEGVEFVILDAPDGDAEYRRFRDSWKSRVTFFSGSLAAIADQVSASSGVVATDNFLGHMAGYSGKPVLWINLCSPAAQVAPRGPRTLQVEAHEGVHEGQTNGPTVEAVTRAFSALRGF